MGETAKTCNFTSQKNLLIYSYFFTVYVLCMNKWISLLYSDTLW